MFESIFFDKQIVLKDNIEMQSESSDDIKEYSY